jgi:hypothetical protein
MSAGDEGLLLFGSVLAFGMKPEGGLADDPGPMFPVVP